MRYGSRENFVAHAYSGRIDGVTAPEGRLLFATTNHIERLDPALSRPGRMDVWINFKNATRWQAEGIFKRFFPSKSSSSDAAAEPSETTANGTTHIAKKKKAISTIPLLEEEELEKLAKEFASNIIEDEVSVAALQGYLLKNKTRPRECVKEVAEWIVQERETKEKIKKEKEEVSLGTPLCCMLRLTSLIQRDQKQKEEREKREKEKKKEEDKKAEEAAAEAAAEARRALRKARRAAAAAVVTATPAPVTEALPTPPAEAETPAEEVAKNIVESESSSTETTTDDTDSESDGAEVATIKEPATKDKKEKWVSVKQPSTKDSKDSKDSEAEEKSVTSEQSTTTGEKDEEAETEDTSAIDALVDAATTKSAVETASS